MMSLYLRNIFFFILQPGIVCGLIPWLMTKDQWRERFKPPFEIYQLIGMILALAGLTILIWCVVLFAKRGKGTLSPLDPTKKLVISGFYKYSRNPMYVGVLLILVGETLMIRSLMLGAYLFLVATAFLIYVLVFEERRLQREFGEEYEKYRKKVRRWL